MRRPGLSRHLLLAALVWAGTLGCACVLDWDSPRPLRPDAALDPDLDLDLDAAPPADQGGDRRLSDAPPETVRFDSTPDSFVLPGNWIKIPAGSFIMGSPTDEPGRKNPPALTGEETQHEVTLTYSFEIMDNEVSEAVFEKVMGYNEAKPRTGSVWPYNNASWHEAAAFCNALSVGYAPCYKANLSGTPCKGVYDCSAIEVCINSSCVHYTEAGPYAGKITTCPGYRLPTEAEWEYAYRAGTTTALYSGAIVASSLSCNKPDLDANADKIAWYCINTAGKRAARLDNLKQDNAWKLYNMAGNLREWCHDDFVKTLGNASVTDPVAPPTGDFGVVRGGSYITAAAQLRAAYRGWYGRVSRGADIGLRCVRSLPSSPDAGP